jgi:hypothetical protein
VKIIWPQAEHREVRLCHSPSPEIATAFNGAIHDWNEVLKGRFELSAKLAYICPPFSDLNTQTVTVLDGWIEIEGEQGMAGVTKWMIDAGAAAVHFEDQLASAKKCGHLGGKVLVPIREFIQKLIAARLAAMLRAVLRSASTDSTRPSLFGVQVAGLGRWAYAGSTNGICVATIRKAILTPSEGAPQAWGLFLPPATAGAWVDLLSRAGDGPAEVWVPYADAAGQPYREDRPAPALPTWEALSAALRAALVTCDREKDILPRVEVSLAQGAPPCLVVVSEARRGSATEDRVEAVSLEGAKGAKGAPAAINPRRLLEAIETARVLGDDTDVRVAWEYSGSGTMWATGPAGYRSVDAPWWVTTCGVKR